MSPTRRRAISMDLLADALVGLLFVSAQLVNKYRRFPCQVRRDPPRLLQPLQHGCINREVRRDEVQHVANWYLCDLFTAQNVCDKEPALPSYLIEVGTSIEQRSAIRSPWKNAECGDASALCGPDDRRDCGDDRVVAAHPDSLCAPRQE